MQLWVVFANTDTTEGRGFDVPVHICSKHATALRMSKRINVQGSDGYCKPFDCINVDGQWYLPIGAVRIHGPSREDDILAETMARKKAAITKAVAAGLSENDLDALGVKWP